jgi:hypothetical protein
MGRPKVKTGGYGDEQVCVLAESLPPEMHHETRYQEDVRNKRVCKPILSEEFD